MQSSRDIACDTVIVGSGLGGSTFAYGLARRGFDIVVIDEGQPVTVSNGLSPVHESLLPSGPHVGGLTKTYGAAMYRLREFDFEATELEAGVSPAWPFRYADLEPYYGEAERLYRVHGSSENDPSEPPRSTPWPYAPIPHQGPVRELVERITHDAGVPVSHVPRAIDYDPEHGGACVLCRHCDAYFCPRDAKMDAEIAALRPAMRIGAVRVMAQTECLRVLTTSDGRKATGVRVRREGEEYTIHARIVALACGIAGTPTLLWRSRSGGAPHPNGVANGSGTLGRQVAAHRQAWVLPVSPLVQRVPFHQKTFAINAFYASAPHWPHPLGTIQSAGYIEPLSFSRRYRPFVAAALFNSFQAFVMTEMPPSPHTGYVLTDGGAKPLGMPLKNPKTFSQLRKQAIKLFKRAGYPVLAPRIYGSWHSVGSARMGKDPSTSIVDSFGRTHDVDGLYVVDASALPSAGAVNTGLTIAAVALRAAEAVPKS